MPDEKREIVGMNLLDSPDHACSLRIFQLLPQVVFFQIALHGEPGGTQLFCVPRHLKEIASLPHQKYALRFGGIRAFALLKKRENALEPDRAADGRNIFSRERSNESIIAAASKNRRGKVFNDGFVDGT